MNARLPPEIVVHVEVYEPLQIMDPHSPGNKDTLGEGTHRAEVVGVPRSGREDVDWLVFPTHGRKGLTVQAFREREKDGAVDVEQNINGTWESYFK